MPKKEFEKLNKSQLESKLEDYKEAFVNYRFQKVLQQLEDPFQIRFTKKKIAQIKTILREYELGIRKVDYGLSLTGESFKSTPLWKQA